MTPADFIDLGKLLLPVGALYGAIRSDLKNIREKAVDANTLAASAHTRLDDHIERHHTK